ncbi:unnamed protein product [Caenorhabditis nigoni]
MGKSSSIVRNTDHDLKSCISKEVLEKKPIFESYRNFCGKVGQNAMEYPDFEFWYYRFYHREMDFDYERSMDPVSKTLMDMPVRLMQKITENLDPVERAYLRSMNKSIKDAVDSHPPSFDKIEITVSVKTLLWKLNNKKFDSRSKAYKSDTQSDVMKKKRCMENLALLFKIPKIKTNSFSLELLEETSDFEDLLPVPFHSKSVSFRVMNMNQIFSFLSTMKPGELESISLKLCRTPEKESVLRFFETEQFKHAKHVLLEMQLIQNDLLRFSHLKHFEFELNFREQVDFQRIRDMISTFKQFESCTPRPLYK